MIVDRYGVHWAPGKIAWLLQGDRDPQHVLPVTVPCPYQPRPRGRPMDCPHSIDLGRGQPAELDPLAAFCLPLPGPGVAVLRDPGDRYHELLTQLSRLSSGPAQIRPIWAYKPERDAEAVYRRTNLGPLIWTGVTPTHQRAVDRHTRAAITYGRRVLFVTEQPTPVARATLLTAERTDYDLDLEAVGAAHLREYMRG